VDGGGVAQQAQDPDSVLQLYRDLIAARRALGAGLTFLDDAAEGVLAYRRGEHHVVAINMSDEPRRAPTGGTVVRATHAARHPAGASAPALLLPGEGVLAAV